MHFHLPKPLHGWREFAGEVGIIVIGVLIALGAEQVVSALHDRREAQLTRRALADEIAVSAADAVERVALEDCLRNRIGELAAKLNTTNGRWTADPMKLGQARVSARESGRACRWPIGRLHAPGPKMRGKKQSPPECSTILGAMRSSQTVKLTR